MRFLLRSLMRRPAFAVVAIGTIAVAIAANTAIFSIVHGVLLRPLPYRDAERLVTLDARAPTGFLVSISIPNYRDWRDRARVFEAFGGSAGWDRRLTGRGAAQVVRGRAVVGDFFGTLGIEPQIGRLPTAEETADHEGTAAVVVLGHALWQQRFGGDPGVLGASLVLGGTPYTVIGVLPAGVGFPSPEIEVYFPMGSISGLPWDDRDSGFDTRAIGRLAPGISLAAAHQDLDRVGREVRAAVGRPVGLPNLESLTTFFVGDVRTQLWILMGAVGFVLLIAVANVGNLLLARAEERQKELAVRAALGAGRGAVIRLLLSEALVVAGIGGALGAGLAYAAVDALVPLLPAEVPAVLVDRIRVDGTVLLFAVGLALLTGFLFGLLPAVRSAGVAGVNLVAGLRSGARTATVGRGRLRSGLVVAEVALALVILIGAGLMLLSLDRLSHVDKGFESAGVFTSGIAVTAAKVPDEPRWHGYYDDLRARAAALPGVRSAALALLLPLTDRSWELRVHPEGVPVVDETGLSVLYNIVSPEYFATMGVPIVRGRGFSQADRQETPLVAIIDETMARRFWPGAEAVGQRVTFEKDSAGVPVYRMVVGVARNVRHYELQTPSRIQVYVPVDQTYRRWGNTLRMILKTSVPPSQLTAPVRALVTGLDQDGALFDIHTLDDLVDGALAQPRAMTRMLTVFAAGALFLAAFGIFGVISYEVTRRTREIGIRIALGAATVDILKWIGGRVLRLTAGGLAIGLVAAVALTRLLTRLLFEVRPLDPAIYGVVAVVLGLVALVAAYVPARRASRVDPVTVLNEEG